jgi:pimeloyl-ACP methyl ester carboxylesterase
MKRFIWLAIILFILTLPYFILETEWHELDDDIRKKTAGSFIKLNNGFVHYEFLGPDTGKIIVLVNGISIPYIIWDHTFYELANEGYRVLRYDLFGRGFSDRPDVIYNEDLYQNQLYDLLDSLKISGKINLVGLSMGGVIAMNFADCYPDKVEDLALIDPAGFVDKPAYYYNVLNTPVLGSYLCGIFGNVVISDMANSSFYDSSCTDSIKPCVNEQLKYSGYKKSLISTFFNFNLTDKTEVVSRLGKTNRRIMMIWGKEDRVIPFSKSEIFQKLIPGIEFYPIEKAGHIPQYEKPDEVNLLLINFFVERNVNTKFNIGQKDIMTEPKNHRRDTLS